MQQVPDQNVVDFIPRTPLANNFDAKSAWAPRKEKLNFQDVCRRCVSSGKTCDCSETWQKKAHRRLEFSQTEVESSGDQVDESTPSVGDRQFANYTPCSRASSTYSERSKSLGDYCQFLPQVSKRKLLYTEVGQN